MNLSAQGNSGCKIAKTLELLCYTVRDIIKYHKETGLIAVKQCFKRNSAITDAELRILEHLVKKTHRIHRSRVIRIKSEAYNIDCLRTKVKFPASIMVWSSMSSSSVDRLYFADGIINAYKYIEILEQHLLSTIESLELDGKKRVFQQDSAPCHSARKVKVCMTENNLKTLPWVSSSPDLSPIETLWSRMKKKLREHPAQTLNDLKHRLQEIWDLCALDEYKALVDTMPSRIEAVLKHKGGATQW
ncbi:hypothetical protein ILUMI_06810 [Ignelater luminosus]|uniref:Tc1-like transposase DDE domain-containing protein n=1 Tax=Ignelater luminosus TaxID=2038154 RepID=A0A8K0GF01_IGNLU|nr:hypothetical protein ILUMI_06810 [Ignelater luminosus]